MGITARHIIADIESIATSGIAPNEFRIEPEQILYWINQTRSMLISQAIKNRQNLSDAWMQTIGCLELEQRTGRKIVSAGNFRSLENKRRIK